jgi:hypothetical protein
MTIRQSLRYEQALLKSSEYGFLTARSTHKESSLRPHANAMAVLLA